MVSPASILSTYQDNLGIRDLEDSGTKIQLGLSNAAYLEQLKDQQVIIDPEVFKRAQRHLTGNPSADREILHFYQTKHEIEKQQRE